MRHARNSRSYREWISRAPALERFRLLRNLLEFRSPDGSARRLADLFLIVCKRILRRRLRLAFRSMSSSSSACKALTMCCTVPSKFSNMDLFIATASQLSNQLSRAINEFVFHSGLISAKQGQMHSVIAD